MNSLAEIRHAFSNLPGSGSRPVAVEYLPQVDSTNSELKRLAAAGGLDCPTVLITDRQTEGRGTRGRSWSQLPGKDIALTLAVPGNLPGYDDIRLPLAVGAAAAVVLDRTLAELNLQPGRIWLRWPNDLCLGLPPRKFGGLLLERSRGWVFAGLGVNVNSTVGALGDGLGSTATTIRDQAGHDVDRRALAVNLITGLVEQLGLANGPGAGLRLAELCGEWARRDRTAGKEYRLVDTGELVTAVGVDPATGSLTVKKEGGSQIRISSYSELAGA